MTLSALIRKRPAGNFATAIRAIPATDKVNRPSAVARIATVAVANPVGGPPTIAKIAGIAVANPQREEAGVTTYAAPTTRHSRWLLYFTDRERVEVWFAPAVSHDEALAAYTEAVAAEPIRQQEPATSCRTCRHLKRPGLSAGCCGERDDLPPAYGPGHPLRRLPDDQGKSCTAWELST